MKKSFYIFAIATVVLFAGWGSTGHRIINKRTNLSFPSAMSPFSWFPDSMSVHASDADYRKNTDPTEEFRHYIDIEFYPEYLSGGRIPQTWDSLVALHGLNFVINNGYVPFAIIATADSVKKYFQLRDWRKAMLKAADLGHYVADAHNPLHCTRYYNGWSTMSNGIHSRYETTLINRDTAYIQYTGNNVNYINDINNFAFGIVYNSNSYRDSVYRADSIAQVIAGSNSSTLYYQNFWYQAGTFTIQKFKDASYKLMCLVYTAWVNAGSPVPTGINGNSSIVEGFKLHQNYPNPFNPKTNIRFSVLKPGDVNITVYDISGKTVKTLFNGYKQAGEYEVIFDGEKLSSGVYFYIMTAGNGFRETKIMTLIK
ncbi:MAG: T9SS type A sorting domain-containing protein [Ignavibacteriae bacterium]|nr:T9SS type A sorting domain-containing protein [Ignavibacteriota bacterium]